MKKHLWIRLLLIFATTACGPNIDDQATPTSSPVSIQSVDSPFVTAIPEVEVNLEEAKSREHYLPFEECNASRVHEGDFVYMTGDETSVGIRSYPDIHISDNIVTRTQGTELVHIVGGPYCSYGWILWKVETSSGAFGWIPESDGDWFWLFPIDGPHTLPEAIKNDSAKMALYTKIGEIMQNHDFSDLEKRDEILKLEQDFGKGPVNEVVRYVPVYNSKRNRLESFESYWRTFAGQYGQSTADSLMETDPYAASYMLFMDPTESTVKAAIEAP